MDEIDVRILNLSHKLSSNPYQDPNNNQYISYLPSSEREISPVPHSGQDSPLSTPTRSLTPSHFSIIQGASPSTSVSSRSPINDSVKPATKRPNAIFNLSSNASSKKTNKLTTPTPVETPPSNPPPKKKPSSIFLNAGRPSQTGRAMNSSSPSSATNRALSSPKRKVNLKAVKSGTALKSNASRSQVLNKEPNPEVCTI